MKMPFILVLLLSALLIQNVSAQEESIPKRVGDNIKKGGEAAGRGIEKGGKATVKGVKKASSWVGKKLQVGGEKLEKAGK